MSKETQFCEMEGCEREAVHCIHVSCDAYNDEVRWLCEPCRSAYATGKQHVQFYVDKVVNVRWHELT